MATAEQLREEFIRELERMKMRYQVVDEADNIVRVSFGLDEMAVTVFIDFDDNEDRARAVHFPHRWLRNSMKRTLLRYS